MIVKEIIDLNEETTLLIRKFDIPKSNKSTSEYVTNYNDITVVNITPEELSKYPVLKRL